MSNSRLLSPIIVVVVIAITSASRAGPILHVDDDASPGGDGLSWESAYRFLQDALAAASAGPADQIRVAQGTYAPDRRADAPDGTGEREATFQLLPGIALRGGFAGIGQPDPDARNIGVFVTVLSGDLLGDDGPDFANYADNSRHVVTVIEDEGLASLDGFTIRGGNADDEVVFPGNTGGGIHIESGSPVISDCTIIENSAKSGGGLSLLQGSPTLERCVFSANVAVNTAGAVRLDTVGGLQLTDCVFSSNVSQTLWGGAIEILSGTPTLTRCSFVGNVAAWSGAIRCRANMILDDCEFIGNSGLEGAGGAVGTSGGTTIATGCTFRDNFSVSGGAVASVSGYFIARETLFEGNHADGNGGGFSSLYTSRNTLVDCVFVDNVSEGPLGGGGIYHESLDLRVVNCSFRGNSAVNTHGGAISLDVLASGTATIQNCLIHLNDAALFGGGVYIISRYELALSNCTIVENVAGSAGGGIYFAEAPPAVHGLPRIDNSIVHANGGGQIDGFINPAPLPVRYCNVEGGFPGQGNVDADPVFVDPDQGDFHLAAGSPCIDAGHNWGVWLDTADVDDDGDVRELTPLDLDGNPRFTDDPATQDTGCGVPPFFVDMGAYEFPGMASNQIYLGDLDGDRVVGIVDFLALLANWGPADICVPADLDVDGEVGITDFLLLLGNWG